MGLTRTLPTWKVLDDAASEDKEGQLNDAPPEPATGKPEVFEDEDSPPEIAASVLPPPIATMDEIPSIPQTPPHSPEPTTARVKSITAAPSPAPAYFHPDDEEKIPIVQIPSAATSINSDQQDARRRPVMSPWQKAALSADGNAGATPCDAMAPFAADEPPPPTNIFLRMPRLLRIASAVVASLVYATLGTAIALKFVPSRPALALFFVGIPAAVGAYLVVHIFVPGLRKK